MSESPRSRRTGRSNVTTACTSCRASKLKCDASRPRCSRCTKKDADCQYPVGEDKRKVSIQNAIPLLLSRIRQLSQFIEQHGMGVPAMDRESQSVLNGLLNNASGVSGADISGETIPNSTVQNQGATPLPEMNFFPVEFDYSDEVDYTSALIDQDLCGEHTRTSGQTTLVSDFEDDVSYNRTDTVGASDGLQDPMMESPTNWLWGSLQQMDSIPNDIDWEFLSGLGTRSDDNNNPQVMSSANNSLPFATSAVIAQDAELKDAEDNEENDVITSLSTRLGALKVGSDGQLRYYGATSNFNLLKVSLDAAQTPATRSIRNNGQEVLDRAEVGAAVDQELEDHVINLYFTWQDPSYHVVDRNMFETARTSWTKGVHDSPYYSEVLKNAMCAVGAAFEARFHPSFPTFPKPLAEYFGDRAKALLDIELDSPIVATVQALVILSSNEAAHKRDARGWLYSGMAMRLALDLGLHIDDTEIIRLGQMTPAEGVVRRTTFWGCFINTHLWSFYLGRDFRVTSGDISVKRPCPRLEDVGSWKAYNSSGSLTKCGQDYIADPIGLVTLQWITLCEMIAPLAHVLYGDMEISKPDLQELSENTVKQLWSWKENLNPMIQFELNKVETTCLPHVLILHMQYYSFLIFVHRPWVSKSYVQPFPPKGPGYKHAREVCIESAVAVSKILRIYEKQYTFRLMNIQAVHIIFTTIPVLIFATMSANMQKSGGDLAAHLGTCFRALEVLGQIFDSAKRAYEYLQTMQRIWPDVKHRAQISKRRRLR